MPFDFLMLLLGVVLITRTFVFVSVEFSLAALGRTIVEKRATQGDPRTRAVLTATHALSVRPPGVQIGIALTMILLGYTTQSILANLLSEGPVNTGPTYALASNAAAVIAAIVINAFSMLFGELVPKNLALVHSLETTRLVVAFRALFTNAVKPLILILNGTANRVLCLVGTEPQEEISSARSAFELEAVLCYSAQEGTVDASTASPLVNAIHISDLTAVGVMTDRGRMRVLESTATAADVVALSHKSDHSRFPVIGDDLDDIIDLVSLKCAIAMPFERRTEVPVVSSSLSAEAPSVPKTTPVGPLMVQLRNGGPQTAVVINEYGEVSGAVALEDVIEEIVGGVSDEHDGHRRGICTHSDGQILVPSPLRPDGFAERARITLPKDRAYNTLASLVMARLGCVAQIGDVAVVEGYASEIVQMQRRCITQAAIAPPGAVGEEEVEL